MTMFQVYAIAAPLNAFLWCAFITYFMRKWKIKTHIKMIITYIIYVFLAFAQCAGGNGIFNVDMSVFNTTQFIMFITAGLCVCIGIYCLFERNNIAAKIAAKKGKK